MKRCWLIKCLLMLFMALPGNSESYYSINAPGLMKSNRKYSVVVTLHEASGPCSIRVGIEGPSFKEFKDVDLQPFESQVIEFFPKKLQGGNYFLRAEGLNGLSFKNESTIFGIVNEGPKIYIQTDKAIYKPQDLVRFRFVLLDEHTRPLNIEAPIRVEILDSRDNRVKLFKNVTLKHGIFTGELQLSKYALLGPWQIKVAIDGTYDYSSSKSITISNYILPKFSIYLKAPWNVVLADGLLKVGFYGKYTFEKYVEGNATIELLDGSQTVVLQSHNVDIQNFGFVDFNLKTFKDIEILSPLCIKASLTEKYTGKTETVTQFVAVHEQRYKLIIPDEKIEFENNKPYSITVYVRYWTGAPVLDRKSPVTMEHGSKIYKSFLDSTGAATFEFDYNANAPYQFQFKDSKQTFPVIYANENLQLNNREFYCRLKLVDKKLQLGQPVLIEVSSIVNIPYLMYIVMGHASIIRTEYIKVPSNQKSYIINITPSIEMIPSSFIYVYYVHKGNLRYEEMTLNFPREFENQISLSAPKQVAPAEEVTIILNAQPQSYVGILAVDLGVFLLEDSYDFKKDTILNDLNAERSYSVIGNAEYPGVVSGLITLTNAHYPFKYLPYGPQKKADAPIFYRFRQKFPETWIFDNYLINDTPTKITLQIPDTITTWRITAFSNNAVTGFGIVDKPTDITTIDTFFIFLNLPYSVKRGEILTIPITIFNYSNQTLDTEVILYNEDNEFYFMELQRQDVKKSSDEEQQIKQIKIPADKGKTVKFLITPHKVGKITIKVAANSSQYWDGVLKQLKVEPNGVPKQENQASYISIPEGEKISARFQLSQPVDSVPDSEYITFSVGGHYLVPTVENFEDLTQIPTGSGEQNMLNFAPSFLILQYLKVNGKLSKEKELVESLISSLEIAYQQQLSFRHSDGGYSVFGILVDEEPSTWLTAYVARYFIKASTFLDIEEEVIEKDLEYLASQQKLDGEFSFTGYLFNPNHQNEQGLTAFILLTFLEDPKYAKKYQETIKKGLEFLNSIVNDIKDIQALCLITAVLKRAKLQNSAMLIEELKSHGKESNGLRWWSANDHNPANDIEITANAALTLLETPGDHTSILKWLIQQRNANGGFISCDDTVAGMEALVKFSEKYTNLENVNLKVSYSAMDEMGNELANDEFYVDRNNVLNFQTHELPSNTRHVAYEMEGNGASLVQLSQQYNVNNVRELQHFNIEAKPTLKNADEYLLELCFTYLANEDSANETTNMVIAEVNLPSGYYCDIDNNMALKQNALVKTVELKKLDSVVVLYLDKLSADIKYCLDIELEKRNEVMMRTPVAIIMYDYYNLSRSSTEFYSL